MWSSRVAPWLALVALSLSCQRQTAEQESPKLAPAERAWPDVPRERWAASLHGYKSTLAEVLVVKSGAAQGEYTDYIGKIHDRLHPIFADVFLASLDGLPEDHPLSRERLNTSVEIVLNADGSIARLGVIRSSGVEQFDIGVLESISRASPFGKPPKAIVSIDGRVYVRWQLWRHPYYACSTYFGKVHILRARTP